jgi:hypothetical protein
MRSKAAKTSLLRPGQVGRAAVDRPLPAGVRQGGLTAAALGLQRTLGNRLTGRLLADALVEKKLTINCPGDRHELQADPVADGVMQAPEPPSRGDTTGPVTTPEIPPSANSTSMQVEMPDEVPAPLVPLVLYYPTITRGGAEPVNDFGITQQTVRLHPDVTPTPTEWLIDASIEHLIEYQLASNGPQGQTNITDENDPSITHQNYEDVARDLTPDMSNLNGYPPRKRFWSKPLTERHELFHCHEARGFGESSVNENRLRLESARASTGEEAYELVAAVPDRITGDIDLGLAEPGREERAYSDGAPAYRTLAETIKTKGDKGDYRKGRQRRARRRASRR